jgi:UDP-galactopyranose mutase
MKKNFSIIGGGVIGCVTALYLKQNGHQVSIFEKKDKLGGVLNDYSNRDSTYLRGCQYFNVDTDWFKILENIVPDNLKKFKYNYASITNLNKRIIYSDKFAIPVLDIGEIHEKEFSKSIKSVISLEDKINLYPMKAQILIKKFLKNCQIESKYFPNTSADSLQISRIFFLNNEKKIFELKKKNFFNEILALERNKIFENDLEYSLPVKGYNFYFEKLLKKLKEKKINVFLESNIVTKWNNKKLEIYNKGAKIIQDHIFWSGNPTSLIYEFNSTKLESFVFKNIQINADLKNSVKKNMFIQFFPKKSKILRVNLYKLNNKSKISIECLFNKIDPKIIIDEVIVYLKNFNLNIDVVLNSVNKKINSRFDIFTLNDKHIIEKFLTLTKNTNLLYSPWLIYGRENKIRLILENLKKKNIIKNEI